MFGKTKVRHRSTPGAGIFRPYHRPGARAAAVLLSFCVAFTMMPAPAFAAAQDPAAETGLCEHHPAHTEECGYREAEPGHPCEHEHTADCYTDELICGYIEDEDVTASDSDAGHVHTQECYALDCPHERGSTMRNAVMRRARKAFPANTSVRSAANQRKVAEMEIPPAGTSPEGIIFLCRRKPSRSWCSLMP